MQALNLYSQIEQDLDFSEEISRLYNQYINIINSKNISKLIDIGCGQGEFLLHIQQNGIDVFGIDLSSSQIEICKSKNIPCECIDIKDITSKYDCATAIFDVINYIPYDDLKQFFSSTYDLLEKNGYFIFDINSLYGFEEIAQGSLNIDKDDKFISIDAYFEDDILTTQITLFRKENELFRKEQGFIEQFYYSNTTLIKLLKQTGFSIEKTIEFNLHDEDNADKYIFVCKKI